MTSSQFMFDRRTKQKFSNCFRAITHRLDHYWEEQKKRREEKRKQIPEDSHNTIVSASIRWSLTNKVIESVIDVDPTHLTAQYWMYHFSFHVPTYDFEASNRTEKATRKMRERKKNEKRSFLSCLRFLFFLSLSLSSSSFAFYADFFLEIFFIWLSSVVLLVEKKRT